MSEILLYIHIGFGIMTMTASMHAIFPKLQKLQALFWPSIAGVVVSGAGLAGTGVSIARVCASGTAMTAGLIAVHYISRRKLAATVIKK